MNTPLCLKNMVLDILYFKKLYFGVTEKGGKKSRLLSSYLEGLFTGTMKKDLNSLGK